MDEKWTNEAMYFSAVQKCSLDSKLSDTIQVTGVISSRCVTKLIRKLIKNQNTFVYKWRSSVTVSFIHMYSET